MIVVRGIGVRGRDRQSRDAVDSARLSQWFDAHPPSPQTSEIMFIWSGGVGDVTTACYDAVRVGERGFEENSGFDIIKNQVQVVLQSLGTPV